MDFPKLVIASDGFHTAMWLDGVMFGAGIEKLVFSADGGVATISLLNVDVNTVRLSTDAEKFSKFMEQIAQKRAAPVSGECGQEDGITQKESQI